MRLNETPVRTSNNFNINNIELDIDIPSNLKMFETVEIINENCSISKDVTDTSLIYGTGLKVQNSNNNLKIVTEGKNANVKLVYNFDANNSNLVNNIEILAENDLNLVIQYSSNTNSRCFHNGIIKLKANANVNITIVNMLNELSDNFESIESIIENESKVNYTIIDIGAKNSISNYYANALGKKCENNVKTIYLGTQNQLKDINYIVDINGQESKADIDVQGALKDESKKHFKETIDFKKGCKKAKGNENEDSDIDIAIISSDFKDVIDDGAKLIGLTWKIDTRIEPHPITTEDFKNVSNPFIKEVLDTGIKVA